ncbi:hypothetical protein C0Q70_16193 [Pomacea canaliculata]|uniref:Uncharacterized protein n=1 Tax=Pomacea canaliculata TaxID=400727 RepID=A0A2T7NP55_POMCA|nr:hypothetical protein C0Q70_16193 [Pomacea canaliculata]
MENRCRGGFTCRTLHRQKLKESLPQRTRSARVRSTGVQRLGLPGAADGGNLTSQVRSSPEPLLCRCTRARWWHAARLIRFSFAIVVSLAQSSEFTLSFFFFFIFFFDALVSS